MSQTAGQANVKLIEPAVARHLNVAAKVALRLAAAGAGVILVAWIWRLGMAWIGPSFAWILVQVPLGACTATDIVIILGKKRQKLESLNVVCSGERAADPPQVWTKFELVYQLRGDLDDAAVKHAIELSEGKYCSVSAMLRIPRGKPPDVVRKAAATARTRPLS